MATAELKTWLILPADTARCSARRESFHPVYCLLFQCLWGFFFFIIGPKSERKTPNDNYSKCPKCRRSIALSLQYRIVTSVYRCERRTALKVNNSAREAAHQNANDLEAQRCGHVGSGPCLPRSLNKAHNAEVYRRRLFDGQGSLLAWSSGCTLVSWALS